ncbi:hypothetical protein B0H34DRAFT_852359, partial [Crassisporium funariophilum]
MAAKCAHMMPLFLKYSCYDEENNIWYANHALLLADKICTFYNCCEYNLKKQDNNLTDIEFCIEHLDSAEFVMHSDLKALYSANNWAKV